MSFVNFAKREVQLKIVYYGPGLCGKTTNLQFVHARLGAQSRGNLTSLATSQERTLFFDFMPLVAKAIENFTTRFQLYTVPGQVMYNRTRQLVLRGVDGVVFVADSQWNLMAENVESFKNLEENLRLQGDDLEKIPYVLQYNKRDLPEVAPTHYLDFVLNNRGVRRPRFNAVATEGNGVFETLNMIARLVLHRFVQAHSRQAGAEEELVLV
ncbi:MAG: GTPase domain-containing protein [Candidatus Marinimicrobia bacterium]|nr:GTPase domain-containing protein [Candidatus Neomarinimicrobiota bacterium]